MRLTKEQAKRLDEFLERELGYRAAYCLAFSGPDYQTFHWITNVTREQGIGVMRETADKMQAEIQ